MSPTIFPSYAVLRAFARRGLAFRLYGSSKAQIDPDVDWVIDACLKDEMAVAVERFAPSVAHAAANAAFVELTSPDGPTRKRPR